ncbi:hypothetical protein MTO98_15425 [Mucilaginibacter sp. SMC90]|uniref:hypothetical protein n=1 Tax=Mucilaginibacter sp. SMC90 TaxID=2929803 RepID=UPI001FB5669E|nr:hypothetical protein [Mucilaginibacter sp. SMC90]UOE52466.1 hypothetical protein MTO98_15425 [Mucilaginibacter sp. SMC90]
MTNDLPLIKICPNCDAMIPIESLECSHCPYVYPQVILTEAEEDMSHQEVVTALNDAFFRLERYMDGKLPAYEGFPFARYMLILFIKTRETANYNYVNCKLIGKYWWVIQQVIVDVQKGDYETYAADHNDDFNDAYGDLTIIAEDYVDEFMSFATEDEIAEETKKHSITDIFAHIKTSEDAKSRKKSGDLAGQPLKKFFKKIKDCSITQLEILNYVESLTEMKLSKLKLLATDFNVYFYPRKEEEEAKYSLEDIDAAIKDLQQRQKQIPYKEIPDFDKATKDEHGTIIHPVPTLKVLNIERLFFPFKFYCCYQFINLLESLIEKHEKTEMTQESVAPNPLRQNLSKLGFEQFKFGKLSLDEAYSVLMENDTPFQIAFLNEAGFIKNAEKAQANTKARLHKIIATALDCPERTVKGNLNVLNPVSKENRKRYTAHLHLPDVQKLLGK